VLELVQQDLAVDHKEALHTLHLWGDEQVVV
jgi:hypothetical protein